MHRSEFAALVGVSQDASPSALRSAYEREMNVATRAGDHRKALALSQAYDSLPERERTQIYSGSRTYATVLPFEPRPKRGRRARGKARPSAQPSRRRTTTKRVLAYAVLVPLVVLLIVYLVVKREREESGAYYGGLSRGVGTSQPASAASARVSPPEKIASGHDT